jgi:hypothetical protein
MEVFLKVNVETTKYAFLSRHQNAGQNYSLLIANKYFENVADFKCLGTTVIKFAFRKKLRSDEIVALLSIFLFRDFCLPISSLKL